MSLGDERVEIAPLRWPRNPLALVWGRQPRGMPNYIWRCLRSLRLLGIACTSLGLLYTVAGALLTLWTGCFLTVRKLLAMEFYPFVVGALVALSWLVLLVVRWRVVSMVKVFRCAGGTLCHNCGYDLRKCFKSPDCADRGVWNGSHTHPT